MPESYDVIIVGAGPAGLTAGLYCAQARLRVLALERLTMGGRIMDIEKVENYPGFSQGISGPELGGEILTQAMNYGMEIQLAEAESVQRQDGYFELATNGGRYLGRSLTIAGGARPKKLNVPGEEQLAGRGVGYCALCEGGQFTDKAIAVVGGGDAGITDALYLSKIAKRVTVVEILPELAAMPLLVERVRQTSNIEIVCNARIAEIKGEHSVEGAILANNKTGETGILPIEGILVRIGWEPETDFLGTLVPLDEKGFVLVNDSMETSVPGVFAAGDIRSNSPMQISTAVGDGTVAALSAQRYLQEELHAAD
jgi:thioredoxin reductase (NADPH)